MDVRALFRGHERLAEHPGAEVRHDHRHSRKARGGRGERERIAEAEIERRRESQLLSDADGQHAAVREDHGAVIRRGREDVPHAFVVQPVSVHRRKEADAAKALLAERLREPPGDGSLRRVEHEKSDKPGRIPAYRRRDGLLVTRNARDEGGPVHGVAVESGDPPIGQLVRGAGIVPSKPVGYCTGALGFRKIDQPSRQELEKAGREEMAMDVTQSHGEEAIIIGLVSDTHGIVRQGLFEALAGVSRILHAGDVGGSSVIQVLERIAPVQAVYGNVDLDDPMLQPSLHVEAGGLTVHVSHGHELGSPTPAKLLLRYAADVIVYGHTHQALVHRAGGRLVVNPGAAGPRRFDLKPSIGRLTISGGRAEVAIVELRA